MPDGSRSGHLQSVQAWLMFRHWSVRCTDLLVQRQWIFPRGCPCLRHRLRHYHRRHRVHSRAVRAANLFSEYSDPRHTFVFKESLGLCFTMHKIMQLKSVERRRLWPVARYKFLANLTARQHPMHAERDIVLSVRLFICPMPGLCQNEWIYRQIFQHSGRDVILVFLAPSPL